MDNIEAIFGKRIKELRLQKGLSQEKLANIADIDRTYVAQVEHGKRNISIKNIKKLCDALDVTLHQFFDEEIFPKGDEE